MYKLGIMQGRLLPDSSSVLQSFPKQNWKNEFSIAEKIGFSFLELLYGIEEAKENPLKHNNGHMQLIEEFYKAGLFTYSICADYFTEYSIIEFNNYNAWKKLKYLVEISKKIKVSIIVIPLLKASHIARYEELVLFVKKSNKIVQDALDSGIRLCIETSLPADVVLEAINENQSELRVCYDLGNATALGYNLYEEIKILGSYISHVHIKDRIKKDGPNVYLSQGDVDFDSAFRALREINYNGNFTLETATGKKPIENATKQYNFAKQFITQF